MFSPGLVVWLKFFMVFILEIDLVRASAPSSCVFRWRGRLALFGLVHGTQKALVAESISDGCVMGIVDWCVGAEWLRGRFLVNHELPTVAQG